MEWLAELMRWLNVDRGDLVVATVGLVIGAVAVWVGRRSAVAAERQATTAAISARAAEEGVQIATRAAEIAKTSAAAAQDQASAALESAKAAKKQLEQDLRMFQEQEQPYVYADIRGDDQQAALLVIIVENVGRAVATEVSVEFDPPLQSSQLKRFANVPLLAVAAMPPGRRVKYFFDTGFAYLASGKPLIYNVRVTANGPHGPTELAYAINLEDLKSTAAADMGNLKDVTQAIRDVGSSIRLLSSAIDLSQRLDPETDDPTPPASDLQRLAELALPPDKAIPEARDGSSAPT